jgi:glycosyltransferase involved in cell wall biosynthesis
MNLPSRSIALVMIARNEARCIERALLSARDWVDEMVVLDTGSTDGTPELAQGCGARVAHFGWVDDFSAARNAALALTDAPWRLMIDADEWVAQGTEVFAHLRASAPEFIGQIVVSSDFEQAAERVGQAPSWLSRVLPRGVLYSGRVHEQPASALPRARLPLVLGHDGYLPLHMRAKQGRNAHLLALALLERPGDAYLQYQLGKDFEVRGEHAQAAPWYEKARAGVAPDAPWRHDLVLRSLFTLKKQGDFEVALALAQQEMPHWSHSPDFYFTLGDLFLDWAHHDAGRAGELLPMIESSWLQAVEIGERPDLPDSVRGRGSFLAAHNLVVLYESLGRHEQAGEWRVREAQMRVGVESA